MAMEIEVAVFIRNNKKGLDIRHCRSAPPSLSSPDVPLKVCLHRLRCATNKAGGR